MIRIQPIQIAMIVAAILSASAIMAISASNAQIDNRNSSDTASFVAADENNAITSQFISLSAKGTTAQVKQLSVTVKSSKTNGDTISGILATVKIGNVKVAQGYTPFKFSARSGLTYSISLSTYQNYTFDHWGNGSTGTTMQITPKQDTIVTGFYRLTQSTVSTGGGSTGSGTTTTPPVTTPPVTTPTAVTLSVSSLSLSGTSVDGLWTVIDSNGQQVSSGFTPMTYSATTGTAYTVSVSDYQQYVFDHWEGGSTSRSITVTPTQSTALKAYYNTGSTTTTPTTPTNPTQTTKTGIIIPLYMYPGSYWDTVVQQKNAHPSVPIVAIVNPSNGPAGSVDSNYVLGIQKLKSAGVIVLGYVYTSYGSRAASAVQTDISNWKSWYGVDGIFFDEMTNWAGGESYYSSLNSYAKSIGLGLTVGNPGTDTSTSYVGSVDNIVIYENSGLPSASTCGGWHTSYSKDNFSILPYGVGSLDAASVKALASYVKYLYVTDDSLPNPWDTLPWYFGDLVSSIDA